MVLFCLILYGLLHLPSVQTWLVRQVAGRLSKELNTKVSVRKVDFRFFDKLTVEDLLIEDRNRDTLLFAGSAHARITDWFFLKDRAIIKYAGLNDAVINLKRTDATWNYQFLIDYFSSPSTGQKKSGGIEFDLRDIEINRLRFNQVDQWLGRDMSVSLNSFITSIKSANFNKQEIIVNHIRMTDPQFMQYDYTGKKPEEASAPSEINVNITQAQPEEDTGWKLLVTELSMKNGAVLIKKEMDRELYPDLFDGQHLFFNQINGKFSNIRFENDSLVTHMNIQANERSGLAIQKLESDFSFLPTKMEFKNLDLQTNRSRLGPYFSMSFESFNSDMSRFLHNVKLDAEFRNSVLSSDDLAFFAPDLTSWKKTFKLDGKVKGTVDDFTTETISIDAGSTRFTGKISMRGLPDINSTFIDLKSDGLTTHYKDLSTLIPSLKNIRQPALQKLGNIYYKGNFTGFINDFVAFGSIRTDLGNLTADLNMKLPDGGIPRYSGKIMTQSFRLGSFVNAPALGDIAINGEINGRGFTLKDLNAKFNGYVPQIAVNGYRYTNITINGEFKKSLFNGHLKTDDPNLRIKSLNGTVDFAGRELAFNADTELDYINLKNLGFSKDNISIRGLLNLNFTGNNIDNFLGSATIKDATVTRDSLSLSFDSLRLESTKVNDDKQLSIRSSQLNADITGQFRILELPDAFSYFLSRYYPSYIRKPDYTLSKQNFRFNIQTMEVDEYLRLFDSRIGGLNDASINGSLNLEASALNITARAPLFIYDGKKFSDIRLTGKGNMDTLLADIALSDVRISDSVNFPETRLLLRANNDKSDINLKTSAGKTLNEAEINASVHTMKDGVKIHFYPSFFTLNNKRWNLEKDGELTITKILNASEISFRHEDERIKIYTELDDITDKTHVVAKLEKVNIGDFAPFFVRKPELQGILSGMATVRDPFGKTTFDFKGTADSFSLDQKYMGSVNLDATANTQTGMVKFKADANEEQYKFKVDGFYNYLDSTGNSMSINLEGDKMNLNILEPYLGTIFSNMDGMAETNLKLSTENHQTYLTGIAKIREASLLVAYTQCRYLLSNEVLKFEKNLIDFGKMRLRDTLNNTATLTGKIYHKFFDDMSFHNIKLETGKLMLLNTKKIHNSQFYGNIIGNASMSINGPLTNMVMNISGRPSFVDSSHIYLPTGGEKESTTVDYIDFVQFGTIMGDNLLAKENTNILVNLSLTATPACKVDLILDEATGDIIKGQGEGQINIRVGTSEPLNIRGNFELKKGEYTFNFQTFLKKQFALNSGSITFNGDPYDAILDLYAEYTAERVDISGLSPTGGFRQKEDVNIISHLTGSLKKPEIDFEFKLPENSDANRNDIIVKRLAEFRNDKNELNKQVASLLLFNSFLFVEQNVLSGGSTFSFATNTVGGIISGWLTNLFNRELERATKGILSTYIDINPTLNLQQNANQLQAYVRAGLKFFLDKRLVLLVGGNLDYNNPDLEQQFSRRSLVTPDISLEYLLTKDGTFRVVGFNRTSIDFTLNQMNRSGLQLSYRKDVDKISDIFRSARKRNRQSRQNELPIVIPADSLQPRG